MTALSTDQRKARIASLSKWGLGLVGAVLIAPFVFLAVKGIVGLAMALIVGLGIIHGAPVLGMKFANWKLKAIKFEASRNPVETMQAVLMEKQSAVSTFADRVTDFGTEVKNFATKLDGFRVQFPTEAPKFEETLSQMQKLLQIRQERLQEARSELRLFEGEIRKVDAIWKMSLAANQMHRSAGMTEDSIMQRIKTETAIDSVQASLNRSLAQLESALAQETIQIENHSSPTIDVQAVEVKERMSR